MPNTVISVEHLSKKYRLGIINNGTLFRDIQTWIALKTGREDPHSKIGEDKYSNSEDHFWALKDVSFTVEKGARVGIIGKNGAGKSTLLRLLSRITAPTEGSIKTKGKIASLLEVGTGFHKELTGRENIYLNGAILGMKKRRIDRKLDEIIAFSGIEHHIDTPVKRYSSGMFVRLAFAVAAHLDSDILIADEVLAVGDAEFQKKALGKMQDLSTGQGRTVLFVSHNMAAVRNLCNCGMVLENGNLKNIYSNILKAISDYSENSTCHDSIFWENEGDFDDPIFVPLKMYLVDHLSRILNQVVCTNECVYICIEADIKEIDNLLNIGVTFQKDTGEIIFVSWLRDVNTYKLDIGKNIFYIKIPVVDLNTGKYRIALHAGLNHVRNIIDPNSQPTIMFSINAVFQNDFGDNERPGVYLPRIEWRKGL